MDTLGKTFASEGKTLERATLGEVYAEAQKLGANDLYVDDIMGDKQWTGCRIERSGNRYRLIGHRDYWDGRISKTPSVIVEGTANTPVPGMVDVSVAWQEAWRYHPDLIPPPCFGEVDEFVPIRRTRSHRSTEPSFAGSSNADPSPGRAQRRVSCSTRCQTSSAPVSTCRCSCGGKTHGVRARR
ncbi:MAG: hypothetical protein IRZ33_09530 [Alicyclobacillaceae bacterium]|nr:hypothetical protein [Alicyclobacillaceae bacterium]